MGECALLPTPTYLFVCPISVDFSSILADPFHEKLQLLSLAKDEHRPLMS